MRRKGHAMPGDLMAGMPVAPAPPPSRASCKRAVPPAGRLSLHRRPVSRGGGTETPVRLSRAVSPSGRDLPGKEISPERGPIVGKPRFVRGGARGRSCAAPLPKVQAPFHSRETRLAESPRHLARCPGDGSQRKAVAVHGEGRRSEHRPWQGPGNPSRKVNKVRGATRCGGLFMPGLRRYVEGCGEPVRGGPACSHGRFLRPALSFPAQRRPRGRSRPRPARGPRFPDPFPAPPASDASSSGKGPPVVLAPAAVL